MTVLRTVPMLLLAVVLSACNRVDPPEVALAGETLAGTWQGDDHTIAAFLGVPYAAPPVGPLRWRAPQPYRPDGARRAADRFRSACVQGAYTVDWYADVAMAFGQNRDVAAVPVDESEDCLYLNVWTPSLSPGTPLPVMVFVHGGANRGGWSYEPNYLGDRLATRGVVVVTIAYRLGPFGFFAHPAIDNGSDPAANFGLLDIRAALAWVRAHAATFGGDPANVTAFGESAGAANLVDLALGGPEGDPGFDRLILQSIGGDLAGRRTIADERTRGERLAEALELPPGASAEDLRAVPAKELLEAANALIGDEAVDAVIDGVTLLHDPADGLTGGRAGRLEVLAGTNRDEWRMYLDPATDDAAVGAWLRDRVPEFAGSARAVVADAADPLGALDRLETAAAMLCPTLDLAAKVSAAGGQAYVYWFTRQRDGPGGELLGAYHGAELPYVFDQHDPWLPAGEVDRSLTEVVIDFWTGFAATGQPASERAPAWPIYTAARPWVMALGDEAAVVEPRDGRLCRYFLTQEP